MNLFAKTIRILLGLLLLITPAVVQAQFTYTTNADNTVTIAGYSGPGGAVAIPTNINGLTVTGIGNGAFEGNTNVTSVTIPASVSSLGEDAFFDCYSLSSVAIPSSVNNFGGDIFAGCRSLTDATISNGINLIPGGMFERCSSLASFTILESVTNIEDYAFAGFFALS